MSNRLPSTSSLPRLRAYVVNAIAALLALLGKKEAAPLVEPWLALKKRIEDERAERERLHDAVIEARAEVRVADSLWDNTTGRLSSSAWNLSGSKKNAPPYSTLFGAVTAAVARSFGPHKAAALGARLLARLKELAMAALSPLQAELEGANARLETAGAARTEATEKELTADIRRVRLLGDVERQIALTEAELLHLMPGRGDLVRAVLSDEEDDRPRRGDAEEPAAPEAPEEPAPG